MNKAQLEVEASKLKAEKKTLNELKKLYKQAANDIQAKIGIHQGKIEIMLSELDLLDDAQRSLLQSKVYQKKFQEQLKAQIDKALLDLDTMQFDSIDDFLKRSYETGYIGTMYDLQKQGIPIIQPIDQRKMVKAMGINSKLSKPLYKKLGEDVGALKKKIANEISRGIATGDTYANIARNIKSGTNVGFNKAMRIARTEGHRIHCESAFDAQHIAQDKGADISKQWDSALDSHTRESHAMVDGEIRPLDEPFSNGLMFPGDPNGDASEVINCRCAILQRASWALDDEELATLEDRASFYGLDKAKTFEEYKDLYLGI